MIIKIRMLRVHSSCAPVGRQNSFSTHNQALLCHPIHHFSQEKMRRKEVKKDGVLGRNTSLTKMFILNTNLFY